MRRVVLLAFVLASCLFLVSCGSSMSSTSAPAAGGVPMTLAIADTPPDETAVLFLEALITDATLQPMDPMKKPVSVLTTPTEVEFGHLQTVTAFLSMANVPPDTYTGLNLTFGSAVLTVVNHSSMSVGGGACAVGAVCEIMPNVSPTMVTIMGAPFPVTFDENSVVAIRLDLNVDSSVQTDLTINPDSGSGISGLMFASGADLLVGQNVQIRPGTASTMGGVTTITTDLVRLWPSQISGTVGGPPSNGTFSLTGLSALFTGASPPVNTINVVTLSNMDFEDFSGFDSLTSGSSVSVKGLLFNTAGTPTLVTRTMRQEGDGGND